MNPLQNRAARVALVAATAVLALAACGSSSAESPAPVDQVTEASSASADSAMDAAGGQSMAMTPSAEATADAQPSRGSYLDYASYLADKATYDSGAVVLFFNASWCPTCREAVGNLEGRPEDIPAGLTVVSVDYDSSDELKRAYGVTTQHTFVQIDAAGAELAKWTGSTTAEAIDKNTR